MAEPKHTPGPWAFHSWTASGKQFGIETADHRHGIASIRPNDTASSLLSMEQHEANARLIAAAPDLLAACQAVMEFLSNGTPVHPGALVQAEVFNAIAKATKG